MHRRFLLIDIIAALVVVGGIVAVGVVVLGGGGSGPAPTPFPRQQITQAPTPTPSPSSAAALLALGNWPTYGYDAARTRFNPAIGLRPPYRVKWKFRAHDLLEFPPSIFEGSLYFCTEHGYVYCLDAATSHVHLALPPAPGQVRLDAGHRREDRLRHLDRRPPGGPRPPDGAAALAARRHRSHRVVAAGVAAAGSSSARSTTTSTR